jgi:dTDP-4-dehydrorhamnose 3,5-epimerase
VTIPAGVWHAERNIGDAEVVIVNFPTEPFHHEAPDKERLPLDTDVLPVDLTGWHGW